MEPKNEKVHGIKESYRLLTFEYAFRQVGFIVLLAIIVAAIAGLFQAVWSATWRKQTMQNP